MPHHLLYVSLSGFDVVSLAAVIGALSCRAWVIPPEGAELMHPRVWRLLAWALFALTLSSVALLAGRTLEMSRQPLSMIGPMLPLVVRKTQFGHIWLARMGCIALLWIFWMMGRRAARGVGVSRAMLVLAAAIAFTRSATGHPADGGQFTFPEWLDWVHLVVASVWAGSVFAMIVGVFPSLWAARNLSPRIVAALGARLSRVASIALVLVLASGFVSGWHYVVHFDNLWRTIYGRILLVKLVLIAVAILLGAANRYLHVPRIQRWAEAGTAPLEPGDLSLPATQDRVAALGPLARTIAIEALFLLGVLLVAALLLHTASPSDMSAMGAMASGQG